MSTESRIIDVMSGRARGWRASMMRIGLRVVEPAYSYVVTRRNQAFDTGRVKIINVGRPVISVGNLTTGGTGKTPIVGWIANHLRSIGQQPAVLLRGYKSKNGTSDEAGLLERLVAPSPVIAQADRVQAATDLIQRDPSVSCFVLDDGFQHRRIARQLNLVLIDATAPFGFGHVLPRGLLREPLHGLRRADAVTITRCDRVDAGELSVIVGRLRSIVGNTPILQCSMCITQFIDDRDQPHRPSEASPAFAVCGIGNPDNFFVELTSLAGPLRGTLRFPDHHAYSIVDLRQILQQAHNVSASLVITTEKDWVKLASLWHEIGVSPIALWRGVQQIMWAPGDETRLIAMINACVQPAAH